MCRAGGEEGYWAQAIEPTGTTRGSGLKGWSLASRSCLASPYTLCLNTDLAPALRGTHPFSSLALHLVTVIRFL